MPRTKAKVQSADLREIVIAFLAKYDEIEPALHGAFAFMANHSCPYSGPTWELELLALREAVEPKGEDGTPN